MKNTPYYRLHCTRRDFDEVAAMSVEGVSRSAIARIKVLSWNTVARWLERAAAAAAKFNDRMTRGYKLREMQADEIKTFLTNKDSTMWILTTIEDQRISAAGACATRGRPSAWSTTWSCCGVSTTSSGRIVARSPGQN